MIITLLLLITFSIKSFGGCIFDYEYKPAIIHNIPKSVKDFTQKYQVSSTKGRHIFSTIRTDGWFHVYSSWCTDESTFTTAIVSGNRVIFQMRANDGRCGYQYQELGSIDFGEPIAYIDNINYTYNSNGEGCVYRSGSNIDIYNFTHVPNLYIGDLSYCPGRSAQSPAINLTINSISVITHPVCMKGTSPDGTICSRTMTYKYKKYVCDEKDKNSQGFGWELETQANNNGIKIDPDKDNINTLSEDIYSHSQPPRCRRKYQSCSVNCPKPLVLDHASRRCIADYATICKYKGMIYNEKLKICEKKNQCIYSGAQKDLKSSYCIISPDCNIINGMCGAEPLKNCSAPGFSYNALLDKCDKATACTELEYVLNNGLCGSIPYCNDNDVQTSTECVNTVNIQKSCAPDARDGNLCYVSNGTNTASNKITTNRALIKTKLSGGFKDSEYGSILETLCTDNINDCQFRLVKIAANDAGDKLCFTDAQGVSACVTIASECNVSGTIEDPKGIKQIKVELGNRMVGYDLAHRTKSIGSIYSSCELSGKVGSFEGKSVFGDITSVRTNKSDLLFWDKYKRGLIGVISFLPTIPKKDIDEGYTYKNKEVYLLLRKGFTAFYSKDNNAVYGVYNGLISKSSCESLIKGTSFYIVQPQNNLEKEIVSALNFKSGNSYNYNDGDLQHGSCVIKSIKSKSFSSQEFSEKTVYINDANSIFVCSPFACKDHYCQYNQCPTNYLGTLYDQSYFDEIIEKSFPHASTNTICTDQLCDSNKPYFQYCGNANGCENKANIYQQNDGTCVEATCADNEQLDLSTGKCIGYGCNGSVERSGKCYKTLY